MWKDRHFSNASGQGVGGCFKHRHRDVQILGGETELGVFRELQVRLRTCGQEPGLE